MSSTVVVGVAMIRTWRHETIRAFNGSVLAYRVLLVTLALAVVGWIVIASSTRQLLEMAPFAEADLVELLVTLTLTVVVTIGVTGTVALAMLVPESDAFGSLLATMPLSTPRRRLALELPVLVCGVGVTAISATPFAFLSAQTLDIGVATALLTVSGILAVAGVLAGATLVRLVEAALTRVAVPSAIARALAVVAVVGLTGYQALGSPQELVAGTWLRRALTVLGQQVASQPALGLLTASAILVATVAAWWFTTGWGSARSATSVARMSGPLARAAHRRPRARAVLELVQTCRMPANVSAVTLMVVVSASLVVFPRLRSTLLWPLGGGFVVTLASLLALTSYGGTWRHHWSYRVWSSRPTPWVRPKWLAALIFCGSSAVVLVTLFLTVPGFDLAFAISLAPQFLAGFVAAMIVGLLVPVGDDQPMSALAGLLLTAAVAILLTVALTKASAVSPLAGAVAALAVIGLALAAYASLARWRERDLVP